MSAAAVQRATHALEGGSLTCRRGLGKRPHELARLGGCLAGLEVLDRSRRQALTTNSPVAATVTKAPVNHEECNSRARQWRSYGSAISSPRTDHERQKRPYRKPPLSPHGPTPSRHHAGRTILVTAPC